MPLSFNSTVWPKASPWGKSFSAISLFRTIELIPDGKNILVTEENKRDYVKAVASWKTTEEIRD